MAKIRKEMTVDEKRRVLAKMIGEGKKVTVHTARQSAQRRVDYYDGWEEEEFPNQRQMNMELREP